MNKKRQNKEADKKEDVNQVNNDVSELIDELVDDGSGLSVEDMFANLGQKIIANSLYLTEKSRRRNKITKEEEDEQIGMIKRFKEIELVFNKLKKANVIGTNDNSKFNQALLKKIKDKRSSMGQIVVKNTQQQSVE